MVLRKTSLPTVILDMSLSAIDKRLGLCRKAPGSMRSSIKFDMSK